MLEQSPIAFGCVENAVVIALRLEITKVEQFNIGSLNMEKVSPKNECE